MLNLTDVSKRFGATAAVEGVSLNIPPGERRILFGPSGCGKTTLLRIIAGLESPDQGSVFLGERDAAGLPPWKRNIGFVFQESALWPHMTVEENIAFGLENQRQPDLDLLTALGVNDMLDLCPGTLSGGQARRVALARALAVRPKLLLLDEPFTNLDREAALALLGVTRAFAHEIGATVLCVTHDREEAALWDAPVLIMRQGRLEDSPIDQSA
ncbi:ATP-binding cassette domain-containing protein [Pseudodesulfovibrio cashew]|uniref:ATP-binding cassette domain-containing protein n=1 Tax=Pseudodesulfovibrio cashew TaxID=2678688 RepID=A0A6I6JC09_9BACT|nr:ABC transporter ATP-binding protein [Pseudodesulfovibrio cashew]QGY38688.1 ATP-binding cassette domain-containing protein [Pseudodesulfovibrio cashew]